MRTSIKIFILFMPVFLSSCKKTSTVTTTANMSVKDIDGNVYDTIRIGTQVWLVQNLKTTRYNDGTAIPNLPDSAQWKNDSTGAYCYYNKDSANNAIYGKLYNWFAVNTGKLAPAGWHVPNDAEWTILANYLGGDSIAGDKMKATTLWTIFAGITNTNSSGFTGLPGGLRNSFNSKFYSIALIGYFWSSTQYNASIAWSRFLYNADSYLTRDNSNKKDGCSVRCIRD